MKLKERLGAFIPRHIPNLLVTGVMWLLSVLHKTSKKQVEQNRIHNESVLVESADTPEVRSFFKAGRFIENQQQWKDVRFGSKYTMAYGGCGIFAVYNALFAMGQQLSGHDVVELISELERNGAVWAGGLGTAPGAMHRLLAKRGYQTCMTFSRNKETINALGEEYDTFIVTVYNDARDVFKNLHNVNISQDERGRFWGHNCYKRRIVANGGSVFVSDGPHTGLWGAIHRMSDGKAEVLSVIGVKS